MFYLVKSPWLLKKIYPECTWNINTDEKILYLTFDDGPHPQVTPYVLEELKKYNARATFFCIGKNVKEYFNVYKQILFDGHKPGNHTYNHLNGWKTTDKNYLENIAEATKIIDSNLFRPPYGRITKFQLKAICGEKLNLKTIMWDVLSGDFDLSIKPEVCYLNVINNAQPGSIIVFHDSLKALPALQYALPRVLKYFSEKGFQFKVIPSQ
ncbi:MAG: polysaccharide deacetylase family protein [Bacteroidota bacterium]|nr:polysaccharide deacetylase family protein [Bacteroidota bacterium]